MSEKLTDNTLSGEKIIMGAKYWGECCPTADELCPRKECPFESYDVCNQAYTQLKEIVEWFYEEKIKGIIRDEDMSQLVKEEAYFLGVKHGQQIGCVNPAIIRRGWR